MRQTNTLQATGRGSALRLDLGPVVGVPRARLLWQSWLALASSFVLSRTDAVDDAFADEMATPRPVPAGATQIDTCGEHASKVRPDTYDPDFDAFFTQLEQPLYGYLRRMVPSDEVAMELAQEAFFRAWKRFAEVRTYDRPDAWLYRVATNLAISYLRRRRPLSFSHLLARTNEGEGLDAQEEMLPFADPHDLEGRVVERDAIEHVLQRLSERQRAALLLRTVQGFSCEEIATTLGITVTNARQTLSRARERFRTLYEAAQREGLNAGQ
ncbi:MAG: RNA polymerase sigma factor [Ktedonobacterales bacterium]